MERIDPEIVDENVKTTEDKFMQGATLLRKYLLNRCQDEFEKNWVPSVGKREPNLISNENYEAAKVKRQCLIRFICELFRLNMLLECIIHECIKKLLIFQGSPKEEVMENLCILMNMAGARLDHVQTNTNLTQLSHAKAKIYMDSYFEHMEKILKLPNLSGRIKFMLMDVIDLRNNAWKPRQDIKTIAGIHENTT
ncbi:hypothetical protein RclHR1_04670005 [Rhizophagus clarus]|uniref:Armadillo-type protein n=1 Tax=Rhizophagus clarus TaxID=94130 RepID=A0A2Z6SC93_9GLOM|nr:hypothetical protein RclHR1_04670005 [Rhizophagus clarus]GES76353.1 armadillo-type protein [Rhizophagus clarus]